MTELSLKRWSGQFSGKRVVATIRRTIKGRISSGGCLVVFDDGAKGLTDAIRQEIQRGWPPEKVRFSHEHPSVYPE